MITAVCMYNFTVALIQKKTHENYYKLNIEAFIKARLVISRDICDVRAV